MQLLSIHCLALGWLLTGDSVAIETASPNLHADISETGLSSFAMDSPQEADFKAAVSEVLNSSGTMPEIQAKVISHIR